MDRIDYIFHRNAGQVIAYGIITEKWDGRFASDHYPVMVLFQWPPQG
jgi:endonuclease/exonuclease/phosphatase family metal-dependent hydrolase